MRWIGRFLLLVAFCSGLFLLVIPTVSGLWQQARFTNSNMDQARASTFFPLDEQQWLNFDVPKGADLFRFYAHAALTPEAGEDEVGYVIDYQWLDQGGNILEKRQHHITTRAIASQARPDDPSRTDIPDEARFYDHQRSRPSRDHALYFNASMQPEARLLRLRVSSMDSRIDQIGIRPFQRAFRPRENVDIAWQRMSAEQRETLSKGALYPSFLLSDYERRNLLSSFWTPVGPLGVLNADYQISTLYQRDADAPGLAPETPAVDGLFAGPQHWITLVLPEATGRYRIEWQSLPDSTAPQHVQFYWQGVDFEHQRQWQAALDNTSWEGSLEGGLLQLIPDQPGILKLYRAQKGEWLDITPQKRYVRAFFCSPDAPVDYSLVPGAEVQALKVDARAYFRQDQTASSVTPEIHFSLLDGGDKILYQQTAELSTEYYPYQHFSDAATVSSEIFEPRTSYLEASSSSHRLRLTCNTPSLVSVYTRPWRHPINRSLPAHRNYWYSYEERDPAWFTLLPDNANTLIRQKLYHSLLWYFKPMGLAGSLTDGDYSWQAVPADNPEALELQVFSSHTDDSESRMDARSSAYRALAGPATIVFAGSSNENLVRPSAVYLRDSPQPQPIQIWIDHVLVLETSIAGRSGRIRLPHLSAGRHDIEIRSEAVRWYVSNAVQTAQTNALRSAYSMIRGKDGSSSLSFTLDSFGAAQQLGFRVYPPVGTQALNCRLSLKAMRYGNLQHSHSFRDFQYHLDSNGFEQSYVLQRRNSEVYGPVRLIVPLDTDLPAQSITARLGCDQAGVLVSAGLISQGLSAFRFFEERHEID